MTEALRRSRHLATLAMEYGDSACILYDARGSAWRSRATTPTDYLCAHAIELSLKARLAAAGADDSKLQGKGHNIASIYSNMRNSEENTGFIVAAEKKVASSWKTLLRDARDRLSDKLDQMGIAASESKRDFGWLDNQEIGDSIPRLDQAVKWLGDRHSFEGSLFRYRTRSGIDSRAIIDAFGLNEDVVVRSSTWAIKFWDQTHRPRRGTPERK